MDIVVCIKQVPESVMVGLDRDTGRVRREESKGVVNLGDRHALEVALALKAATQARVIALAMGPAAADAALRQALAVGCDEAYLVTDPALTGADTGVTTRVLAAALGRFEALGLILLGEQSADGGTGLVPARMAQRLGYPLVGNVVEATLAGTELHALRNATGVRERVIATCPAVLSVSLDAAKPRIPNAMGVMKAAKKPLTVWSLADLGLTSDEAGGDASATVVQRSYKPEKRERGELLQGEAGNLAQALLARLRAKQLVEV